MLRFSPSRLYITRCSINNRSGAGWLDTTRRRLSRYPRQQARIGQNLSERYLRLEKSGREALSKDSHNSLSIPTVTKSSSKSLQVFHGFEIPEEPKPPADDGVCVFFLKHFFFGSLIVFYWYCHFRMLYVWMRSLRVWSSWRSAGSLQGSCFVSTELAFFIAYSDRWMAFLHPSTKLFRTQCQWTG